MHRRPLTPILLICWVLLGIFVSGSVAASAAERMPPEEEISEWRRLVSQAASASTTPAHDRNFAIAAAHLGNALKCGTCKTLVQATSALLAYETTTAFTVQVVWQLCVTLRLQSATVCEQSVKKFAPNFRSVFRHPHFSAHTFCASVNLCVDDGDFSMPTLPPSPSSPSPAPPLDRTPRTRHLKILHFSDWHFDPLYQEGYEAVCPDPICCRSPHAPGPNGTVSRAAGPFGDYRCDSPLRLAEEVLQKARSVLKEGELAMVILSGDLPPHDVWNTTKSEVEFVGEEVVAQLVAHFGQLRAPPSADVGIAAKAGIPVFMTIGNHDNSPPNAFPVTSMPEAPSTVGWLYEAVSRQWSRWLTEPTSIRTLSKYGYYASSQLVPELNIKLISLNTNHGYLLNWWAFIPDSDPDNMLSFLIEELHQAEVAGVDVFILGHIPPANKDVNRYWKLAYGKIIERFYAVIKGQFYGHTHRDEVELFYSNGGDPASGKPISVAYLAPSITPMIGYNPSFRVYDLQQRVHNRGLRKRPVIVNEIVNYRTHVLNLPESNLQRRGVWVEDPPSVCSVYGMRDLSPESWHNLTARMEDELYSLGSSRPRLVVQNNSDDEAMMKPPPADTPLLDHYIRSKYRYLPSIQQQDPVRACSSIKCKEKLLCFIRSGNNVRGTCARDRKRRRLMMIDDNVERQLQLNDLQAGLLDAEDLSTNDGFTTENGDDGDFVTPLNEPSMCN